MSSRERSILGCATLPKGGQENNLGWLKKEAFSERKAHRDRGSKIRIGVFFSSLWLCIDCNEEPRLLLVGLVSVRPPRLS